jgi:hypothetical protein
MIDNLIYSFWLRDVRTKTNGTDDGSRSLKNVDWAGFLSG